VCVFAQLTSFLPSMELVLLAAATAVAAACTEGLRSVLRFVAAWLWQFLWQAHPPCSLLQRLLDQCAELRAASTEKLSSAAADNARALALFLAQSRPYSTQVSHWERCGSLRRTVRAMEKRVELPSEPRSVLRLLLSVRRVRAQSGRRPPRAPMPEVSAPQMRRRFWTVPRRFKQLVPRRLSLRMRRLP
jgi:hypothetical protein